ncbi:MAG: nicotinamide mononucleotide transporter [Bacteroidetes bacterium]|nr:nicotinamide mononucleotide transporter [Bacteroidota bacterium]
MTPLEILGFVFGVSGVWLTIKEKVWCFPVGLVNVSISLYLFIQQQLYSDAVQQGVYIPLLFFGWYNWINYSKKNPLPVSRVDWRLASILLLCVIGLSYTMGSLFHHFTDADVPYIDATATALSFAAQYLIAHKKIENWLLWIPVNILYIGIYFYKGLYLYMLRFTIYLVLAITGFGAWKKELNAQQRV